MPSPSVTKATHGRTEPHFAPIVWSDLVWRSTNVPTLSIETNPSS